MTPYEHGRKSYFKKNGKVECPYPYEKNVRRALERVQWWNGYHDARTDDKLGELFHKWGLTTMYEDRQQRSK